MKFKTLLWDQGDGYIVELEDKRIVWVNIDRKETEVGSVAQLAQFGQWIDMEEEPEETIRKEISKLCGVVK